MKERINILKILEIKPRHVDKSYVTLEGINGQVSIIKKDDNYAEKIKNHLRQEGRDKLKLEIHDLLNIMHHNF